MAQYYKKQPLNVYIVSSRPTGFWHKLMRFLPYNVGQKVQLEVVIESKRDRGLAWMDLTYFEFVEIMSNGQRKIFDKRKGVIYPLDVSPISREGVIEYRLMDMISHEEVLLFTDNTVFLHSSKDIIRYTFADNGIINAVNAT